MLTLRQNITSRCSVQGDWEKVDKSSFCPYYKEMKVGIEREKYRELGEGGGVRGT